MERKDTQEVQKKFEVQTLTLANIEGKRPFTDSEEKGRQADFDSIEMDDLFNNLAYHVK